MNVSEAREALPMGMPPPVLRSASMRSVDGRRTEIVGNMSRASALAPGASHSLSALRLLGWCMAALLIAAALLPLVAKLTPTRAALTLEVSGDFQHVKPESVRRAVAGQLNTDFYQIDLAAVKASVEDLPWVARARVERAWPGTVRVRVDEHRAYARWGEAALLSQTGQVFSPPVSEFPAGLPQLAGPAGQHPLVRETFETLRAQLVQTPFSPEHMSLSARGEWTAQTADGIEIRFGRGPGPEAPLNTVATLAGPVTTALEGRLQEVAYVDLHYINGFAVGWRAGGAGGADDGAHRDQAGRDD